MNLHKYWLSSEVAKEIGIASSNFSQLSKNVPGMSKNFKKVGNMLFMKFDIDAYRSGTIVYRKNLDDKIANVIDKLTVWDQKYPAAAFVEDANISFSNIQNIAKVDNGKYLTIGKTADGKTYVQFKGDLLKAVEAGYSFYLIDKSDFETLQKEDSLKGYIQVKTKYFVWY